MLARSDLPREVAGEVEVDLRALLGSSAELAMQRGEHTPSCIHGVVSRVDYLGVHEHRLQLRVELVPALALAEQSSHSRIWQQRSAQEIVREVLSELLDPYDRSFAMDGLTRGAAPREYCVQYRESDLAFVRRLLEEEGISWFFTHEQARGHELLALCDDNHGYAALDNVDGTATLPIVAHNPDEADLESIGVFAWSQQLTATAVARSDFDPAQPGSVLDADHGGADERGRVRRVYEHGQRRLGGDDLGERVRDLAEALQLSGSVARCQSNASVARPGCRFTLEGLEREAPSEWIILDVTHSTSDGYRNSFRCVPADVPIRPLATIEKPRVLGPQTATVVGGGEIDTDAQGRIEVQFHWEEQPSFGAGASCRVRCAQSWAGPGWGAQFIPRVGMEVVVEFLEGNPDRPLVTGCVYNGAADPPFALPGNATQSGWRSNSSPGGGGSNELRFEDAAGSEQIYMHGQKDWLVEINHDASQSIGHDAALGVGNDRSEVIGNDDRESVGANKSITVGKAHDELIGASMSLRVGVDQNVLIASNQTLDVGGSQSVSIGASASETVAIAKTVTIGGALATIVGAAMNTSVGGMSAEEVGGIKSIAVGGTSSESVVGSKSVDAASIAHTARKDLREQAGQNLAVSAGKDLQIDAGGQLQVHGKKKGLIELGDELTIKVGKASITLKKNGEIVLDGAEISVKGKKAITLKAKKVNQN
ncbi:MAG TPA: type VI secretion system tip protein TssI/VgrG [Enhygromyxa sp.]|nr:type VI secretion system tip protein TssI/VgrG [Enhygromyxa sp.]